MFFKVFWFVYIDINRWFWVLVIGLNNLGYIDLLYFLKIIKYFGKYFRSVIFVSYWKSLKVYRKLRNCLNYSGVEIIIVNIIN